MTSANHLQGSRSTTLSAGMRRLLRVVEARVAERVASEGARSDETLGETLAALVDHLGAVVARRRGKRTSDPRSFSAPDLVDPFRREFLLYLSEHGAARASSRDVVDVLLALDETATQAAGIDTTFAARLARLEALRGMTELAHDMRSPLAAILLLVEPIRRGQKGPVTPVQERQLGLIYGAALSLNALANDIIEAGRGDRAMLLARPFSIRGTLDDACALVRPIAEEKRLELRVTYSSVDARIGDSSALHRVVLNLVTNALKYTEAGSVSIECADITDTEVEFTVHDTGDGIPGYVLDSLADTPKSAQSNFRYSSSGLGLAICRALLEKMGSTLRIEPQPTGRGTRISFRLALPKAPGDR